MAAAKQFDPVSPKSDQHQFSPNNINTQSKEMVMRINKMITTGKMLWSFIKFSPLISKQMYEDQSGEFVFGYWGLKGYNPQVRGKNNESSLGINSTWMKVFMNLLCIICLIFLLQEAIKKKLEIQKQKQELLNKQIKEQKVKIMNFIAAVSTVCLTTYPPSHLLGIS